MGYKTLTVEQLKNYLTQPGCILLDHRDPTSYAKAHLPNAKPVSDRVLMEVMRNDKQSPVLVYCYRGNSSKDLATLLVNFGCSNVYNLEGGWQAWELLQSTKQATISPALEKWLVDYGFDPTNINSRIDNGMTTVMQAALLAETSFLEELLVAGADINAVNDDQNNALWFGCVSENIDSINILLKHGIDINSCNVNGATSLIYAASAGKLTVVQKLIEAGSDIYQATLDGFTALDSASTIEILRFLKPQYQAA